MARKVMAGHLADRESVAMSSKMVYWCQPAAIVAGLAIIALHAWLGDAAIPAMVLVQAPLLVELWMHRRRLLTPSQAFVLAVFVVCTAVSGWASPIWGRVTRVYLLRWLWTCSFCLWIFLRGAEPGKHGAVFLDRARWGYLGLGCLYAVTAILAMPRDETMIASIARFHAWLPSISADWPVLEKMMRTNEVGGVLLLFAPLACVAALGRCKKGVVEHAHPRSGKPGAWWARMLFGGAAVVVLGGLILSQSRGSWLAFCLAMAVVLGMAGKMGWRIIGASVPVVGTLIWVCRDTGLVRRLILGGSSEGMTIAEVLTHRPAIWNSAWQGVTDFGLTGMGMGVFGSVAGNIYPWADNLAGKSIEDAHNLFLQTALDLGLPGAVALIFLLAIVFRRLFQTLSRQPVGHTDRWWWLGGLGALLAHTLYSLVDAVSFGTVGNFFFWVLIVLLYSGTKRKRQRTNRTGRVFVNVQAPFKTGPSTGRPPTRKSYWRLGMALAIAGLGGSVLIPIGVRNRTHLAALKAIYDKPETRETAMFSVKKQAGGHCRSFWLLGLLAGESNNMAVRNMAMGHAIRCAPLFVEMAHYKVPENEGLAELATHVQPRTAESWFWAASFHEPVDRARAIALYRHGLIYDPSDGLRWRILGDLLRESNLADAQDAYLQSCRNGDPGVHGCVEAAKIAEQRGQVKEAIHLYRLSNWFRARKRADFLEEKMLRN